MKQPRGTNAWQLILVMVLCAVGTAIGIHEVKVTQKTMILRRAVLDELRHNRALVETREQLEQQVWSLKSTPRVALRASELLGMHAPRRDERIVTDDNTP